MLLCPFLRALLHLIMGLSSVLVLSEDSLMFLLHNMDLLDLCVCAKYLQRVKSMKENLTHSYIRCTLLIMNEIKTLINMKYLILQIQPQCLGTYCGNVQNIRSIEKLMFCMYYFSLADIISNNPFWQRKCSGVSRVNASAALVTSSMVILLLCF